MVSTLGLISYWKMDESSGDMLDEWDTNHGSVDGATQGSAGKINTGYNFDGSNDEVRIPADSTVDIYGKTNFSISMWVYPESDGEGSFAKAIDKANSTSDNSGVGYSFKVRSEDANGVLFSMKLQHDTTNALATTNDKYPVDNWYHILIVYNEDSNKKIKLYVNGSLADLSVDNAGVGTVSDDSAIDLVVGNYAGATTRTWDGNIDEIGLWNLSLTSTDASDLYNNGDGLAYPFSGGRVGKRLQINIGDTWKETEGIKINIGDVWKTVEGLKINIGDAWKTIF